MPDSEIPNELSSSRPGSWLGDRLLNISAILGVLPDAEEGIDEGVRLFGNNSHANRYNPTGRGIVSILAQSKHQDSEDGQEQQQPRTKQVISGRAGDERIGI